MAASNNNSNLRELLAQSQGSTTQQGANTASGALQSGESSSSSLLSPGGLLSGVARLASSAANINILNTPTTTRTLGTTTTPALPQAAMLVLVEVATSNRCMGKKISKTGIRVCFEPVVDCMFAHAVKINLPPGYYVQPSNHPNQLLPAPFISMSEAELHPRELETIQEGEFTTDKLIYLVENFGSTDDADEAAAVEAVGEVLNAEAVSPSKRPRLGSEDEVNPIVKKVLKGTDIRLLHLEMGMGTKPSLEYGNLWNTVAHNTEGIKGNAEEIKGVRLEVTRVGGLATTAATVGKEAKDSIAQLQSLFQPQVINQLVGQMQVMQEDNNLLREVAQQALTLAMNAQSGGASTLNPGSSLVSGGGQSGGVTSTEFATYKADVEGRLRVLSQKVNGDEVSVAGIRFPDLEFCLQHAIDNFPQLAYECLVGFTTLLHHSTDDVETQNQMEVREIHSNRLNRSSQQSTHLGSYKLDNPTWFQVKDGAFTKISTFEKWSAPTEGIRAMLNERVARTVQNLTQHIETVLAQHPTARQLSVTILQEVNTWWTWLSSIITDFYHKLLANAAPNTANPSKEIKASTWKVVTLSIVKLFEELRKARQPGVSAEISPNPLHVVGRFLYATLQELKVMREFQSKGFDGHPSIQLIKMTHVFDNYTPRSEIGDVVGLAKKYADLKRGHDQLVTRVNGRRE